jgi:hypothetical protein
MKGTGRDPPGVSPEKKGVRAGHRELDGCWSHIWGDATELGRRLQALLGRLSLVTASLVTGGNIVCDHLTPVRSAGTLQPLSNQTGHFSGAFAMQEMATSLHQ